jgi:hypothetical protein
LLTATEAEKIVQPAETEVSQVESAAAGADVVRRLSHAL